MKIEKNYYYSVGGIKFTVKEKNKNWNLDFRHEKKRIKRSTSLKSTKSNLIEIEKVILPHIVEELTKTNLESSINIDTTQEIIIDEIAKEHFAIHIHNVREHVYEQDIANFEKHVLPYFKGRTLNSIKPIEITKWQNKLLTKYAKLSVQKYRSIFFSIFTLAINNDYVDKNPLAMVTAPKVAKKFELLEKESINPFNSSEIEFLINIEDDEKSYMPNFIGLMANTGARPGEIIALKWGDINFEKKTISISKTIMNNKIGLPKTRSSVRVIDMISGAFDAFVKRSLKLSR